MVVLTSVAELERCTAASKEHIPSLVLKTSEISIPFYYKQKNTKLN
jgi:hypothetical protein